MQTLRILSLTQQGVRVSSIGAAVIRVTIHDRPHLKSAGLKISVLTSNPIRRVAYDVCDFVLTKKVVDMIGIQFLIFRAITQQRDADRQTNLDEPRLDVISSRYSAFTTTACQRLVLQSHGRHTFWD
jgi:hypothetical protein